MTTKWRLRGLEGPHKGETFVLSHRTVLGRSVDADLKLNDAGLSRQHAAIFEREDGAMVLMDLSSSNGTWMGETQASLHVLTAGDVFRVGTCLFIFERGQHGDGPRAAVELGGGLADRRTEMYPAFKPPVACDHSEVRARGWKFCPNCGNSVAA